MPDDDFDRRASEAGGIDESYPEPEPPPDEAPAPRTVSQLLLDYLRLEGVRYIFGIPGGGVMYLLDELRLRQHEFTYIITRHEAGAAYMADGLHRVTGGLGVVLVTTGPGATNTLTGSLTAQAGHSAVLTITGEVAARHVGKGYLQHGIGGTLDVSAVFRHAVQSSHTISSPDNFRTLFTQALRDALAVPFQSTHVSLPVDVGNQVPQPSFSFPDAPSRYRSTPGFGDRPRTRQALDLLRAADRPVILLGNGTRWALQGDRLDRFTAFVERFAIPVMTSPDGKGLFPESHELALRNYGLAGSLWARQYLRAPDGGPAHDALLVLGSQLAGLTTNNWNPILAPRGPLIQVDANPSVIGRAYPVELGVVAELGRFIDDLCELGEEAEPDAAAVERRRAGLRRFKAANPPWFEPAKRDAEAVPILLQTAMTVIGEAMPAGSHIFIDCSNCVGWSLHELTIDPPTQIHYSLTMAPLGFAVCGVIGAKLGAPDRPCLAIAGDGAFLMHGTEVSTAAQYGIGAIWVVLDNNDLGMVSQGNDHFFPTPAEPSWTEYYGLGNPDLAAVSAGLGADACRVRDADGLRTALVRAIAQADERRRPQVIVLEIDRAEVPTYYRTLPPPA